MAAKYISHFPKPVLDDLVNGKWLPVIGAGMSLNAVVPKGKKMPLWADLGKALTDQLADYSPSSVLDGISAYQHEFDRARLIEQLSEILSSYWCWPRGAVVDALPWLRVAATRWYGRAPGSADKPASRWR